MTARRLFDPDRAKGPSEAADVVGKSPASDAGKDVTAEFTGAARPISVSALLAEVKAVLADGLPSRLAVLGEISNFKRHSSGHLYFSLKDAASQVPAVMFRSAAARLRFEPSDGLEVVAEGRVDVYEAQGKLQLYVERLTPRGAGALELAFRQLVARLGAEGLFDEDRKKPLPSFPSVIGVVTSPTGAAIRDIRRTLARRWPAATVYLAPVRVQGDGAAAEIAEAVRRMDINSKELGMDLLIVGRGGGSLEDLWCFNEEPVARAIAACRVPVISGVGHEVDTTIADMVADVRAATPTAAAELAVPDRVVIARQVRQLADRMTRAAAMLVRQGRASLRSVERVELFRNPLHTVRTQTQRVDEAATRLRFGLRGRHATSSEERTNLMNRLRWAMGAIAKRSSDELAESRARLASLHPRRVIDLARRDLAHYMVRLAATRRSLIDERRHAVDRTARTLEALSYRNVLKRGFGVTRTGKGAIVRQPSDAAPGSLLKTELAEGEIRSVVEGPRSRRSRHDGDEPSLFDA